MSEVRKILAGTKYVVGTRVAFWIGPALNRRISSGVVTKLGSSLGERYYHIKPDDGGWPSRIVAEANVVGTLPTTVDREDVEAWLES